MAGRDQKKEIARYNVIARDKQAQEAIKVG